MVRDLSGNFFTGLLNVPGSRLWPVVELLSGSTCRISQKWQVVRYSRSTAAGPEPVVGIRRRMEHASAVSSGCHMYAGIALRQNLAAIAFLLC